MPCRSTMPRKDPRVLLRRNTCGSLLCVLGGPQRAQYADRLRIYSERSALASSRWLSCFSLVWPNFYVLAIGIPAARSASISAATTAPAGVSRILRSCSGAPSGMGISIVCCSTRPRWINGSTVCCHEKPPRRCAAKCSRGMPMSPANNNLNSSRRCDAVGVNASDKFLYTPVPRQLKPARHPAPPQETSSPGAVS